jgi:hypothetical protein
MGLCFYLAFWTGGDPERMDLLFRESGLMREKWDRRHYSNGARYGEVTVVRALLKIDDYYSPPEAGIKIPGSGSPRSPMQSDDKPGFDRLPADTTHTQAIEDAKLLASTVQRQQRELNAQRERIAKLETRLRWYRHLVAGRSDNHVAGQADDLPDTPNESDPLDLRAGLSPPREVVPPVETGSTDDPRQNSPATGVGSGAGEEGAHGQGVIDRFRRWLS